MRCVLLPLLLVLGAPLAPGLADVERHVIETAHYRLEAEATRSQAEELGRVLEAAWTGFEDFFGSAPKLRKDERLQVRFLASRASWEAELRADRITPPTRAGGYYFPRTKTAYVYRQPTRYFTRVLFVHEAAHQFHYLARTGNAQPTSFWYREGIAEFLSWHLWDGERLVLAVGPPISLKDYPAKALEEIAAEAFDLADIVEENESPGRAVTWALFRYLATGREGSPLDGFETFCRKMDRGGSVKSAFRKAFPSPGKVREAMLTWLRTQQQPWEWVFNQWDPIAPGRLAGWASVVSFCRLREPVRKLAATVEVPEQGRWRAGLLLGFESKDEYVVALVDAKGRLHVDRRANGRWIRLADKSVDVRRASTGLKLSASRRDDGVRFCVGRKRFGPFPAPGNTMGLALDNCRVVFGDLKAE